MKKSLLSAILLSITWAASAAAIQTPLSAIVRLEDDDSPNSWLRSESVSYGHN